MLVDWETLAELAHLAESARLDLGIAVGTHLGEPTQNIADQLADLAELGNTEAAAGGRRAAEADTRSH